MSSRIRNLLFLVGLVAVVLMCFTFDVSFPVLWANICRAGYWIPAIIALWGLLYVLNTLSWRVIIRGSGDCPVPFWHLAKITVSGFALNYATPVGLLGGEPYKIMELKPFIGLQRASSSVLLFAMMHIFSHFWYWLTSIITYLILVGLGYLTLGTCMTVILSLMFLFCVGAIYLFLQGYKNGMVVRLVSLVARIPGLRGWGSRFMESHMEDLSKIDGQISALHRQRRQSFLLSLGLEYLGRMLQSAEIFFLLLLFDVGGTNYLITFLYGFLILAFTSLFANMVWFMPLQLGGREGGFAMSVAQMGMTSDIGIFVSLIVRVREIFWAALGLLLMKIFTRSQ